MIDYSCDCEDITSQLGTWRRRAITSAARLWEDSWQWWAAEGTLTQRRCLMAAVAAWQSCAETYGMVRSTLRRLLWQSIDDLSGDRSDTCRVKPHQTQLVFQPWRLSMDQYYSMLCWLSDVSCGLVSESSLLSAGSCCKLLVMTALSPTSKAESTAILASQVLPTASVY